MTEIDDLVPIGPQVLAENSLERINCSFVNNVPGGIPLPDITWYDPSGTPVATDSGSRIHMDKTFLVFTSVRSSDVGEYTCKASNIAGEKQSQLIVEMAG